MVEATATATGCDCNCNYNCNCNFCQGLFILPRSSTGYTLTVESSPSGPTALVPLGDPD